MFKITVHSVTHGTTSFTGTPAQIRRWAVRQGVTVSFGMRPDPYVRDITIWVGGVYLVQAERVADAADVADVLAGAESLLRSVA